MIAQSKPKKELVFSILVGISVLGFLTQAQADPPTISIRSISPFEAQVKAIDGGKAQDRITGGANAAPIGAYPWVVSLGVRNTPHTIGHFCGAVLVRHSWVLTAAHCVSKLAVVGVTMSVVPDDYKKIEILVGTNLLSAGGTTRAIDQLIVHPDYHTGKNNVPENDLALLHLTNAAAQNYIPLMQENEASEFFKGDSKILIAGWGKVEFGEDQPLSNNLLQAFVSVMDKNACNSNDIYGGLVDDNMLCAGLGVVDACQGDSGGPAMAYIDGNPVLAGIVSWGVSCGSGKYPGVYVKISKFAGWISSQTK